MIRFFLLSLVFFAAAQAEHAVRAAIDIGMGGPKLHIAEIDLATYQIVRSLYTKRYFVNFYDEIAQHADHHLSAEVMKQGLAAFKEALAMAKMHNAEGVVAIATAAFRDAVNGAQFADEIENETGIKVHIVDQSLEGKLAFQAVLAQMDVDAEHLVVWDIGGGSIQFIGTASDGSYVVDCGEEGSGAFKDFIIEKIQQRAVKGRTSPNPMSAEEIVQAEAYARSLCNKVDRHFKDKISHPATCVVGAGNAFGFGIAARVEGKNPFSIEDLRTAVLELENKTDEDLGGGDYACVEGSNVILALGFMQGLGIKQMHIIPVNNADGALIYEPFWK